MRPRCKDMIGSRALRRVFALSVVLTIALASAALADEVTNRIDNSPDAALENITLNEGATQTVAFRVTVQGNDDDSGCNIDSGEQLTVEVSSSDTSVATVSPQTITFTSCIQDQSLTVTALVKGTATITVAQAPEPGSNTTGSGTFDYDPASFTVTVNALPTISDIPDQITDEDTPTGDIPFTVGDAETTASDLTVTGSSSNTTLVPNGNISFGGSGANRTVKATPAANRSGTATITVSVSDGLATTSDTFVLTVNPVDDPPEIDLNGGAAGRDYSAVFSEDVGPVAIVNRNTLTVTDIDSNNLASATVTITNLKDGNAESLAADTAGTSIIATYDATTGELSLTGAAPMADYQSVLRTVTYDNASQNPDTTDRNVTFVVNDGATSSNTATSTVKVNTVNDAPGFIKGADPSVPEDAGRQEFPGWAADISPGPANESNQTVWFEVSTSSASRVSGAMFSEWPQLSPNGTLTFASANNANGEATFGMKLMDDGGRSNGGENASDEQRFKVTIRPENDRPTIELIDTGGAKNAREGETKTYDYEVQDADEPDPRAVGPGARRSIRGPGAASSASSRMVPGPPSSPSRPAYLRKVRAPSPATTRSR